MSARPNKPRPCDRSLRFLRSYGPGPSLASRRLRALLAEPKVTTGGGFILALIVIALFAPWIAPKNPLDQDLSSALSPPGGARER